MLAAARLCCLCPASPLTALLLLPFILLIFGVGGHLVIGLNLQHQPSRRRTRKYIKKSSGSSSVTGHLQFRGKKHVLC